MWPEDAVLEIVDTRVCDGVFAAGILFRCSLSGDPLRLTFGLLMHVHRGLKVPIRKVSAPNHHGQSTGRFQSLEVPAVCHDWAAWTGACTPGTHHSSTPPALPNALQQIQEKERQVMLLLSVVAVGCAIGGYGLGSFVSRRGGRQEPK